LFRFTVIGGGAAVGNAAAAVEDTEP
ncbi:hypothetical protein A2U01_0069333, partial [Trifolium medium]|nr:hypothetical protein [Trifolium medium]